MLSLRCVALGLLLVSVTGSWSGASAGTSRSVVVAAADVAPSLEPIAPDLAEWELRMECLRLFPDRMELFEQIYESRFQRLREQFRG